MQRSMAHSRDENLRIELTAQFNSLTHGIKDAAEISCVLRPLSTREGSSYIFSGLLRRWNAAHCVTRHLPAEMLAGCFTFLPFRARIWASHVSSYWRTASVCNPSVWSIIELNGKLRDEPALLRMALSRTGHRPVDLRYASQSDADGAVQQCMAEHMHHFRTIVLYARQLVIPFTVPAPLLEEFSAVECDLDITEDFLGGRAGRFRELHLTPCRHYMHPQHLPCSTSLPATCLALSTLTTLSLRMPESPEHSASFIRLFQLCPSLEWLSLSGLDHPHAEALPAGPAPRTLRYLSLQSSARDYDVVQHYTAWNSNGTELRDVHISLDHAPGPDFDIARLFAGAQSLRLMLDWRSGSVDLMAYPRRPEGSLRFVSFDDDGEGAWAGAELVLRAQTDALRELCIPSQALAPFLQMGALGDPRCLALVFDPLPDHDWTPLAQLVEAEAACPHLESVQVTVWPMESTKKGEDFAPLGGEDARSLLAALTALDPVPRVPVRVRGFPQSAVEDLPAIEGPGVGVEFEASKCL